MFGATYLHINACEGERPGDPDLATNHGYVFWGEEKHLNMHEQQNATHLSC